MCPYGPNGKVFFCALKYTESWPDGSLAAQFLPHILNLIESDKICIDQRFSWSGSAWNVLVGECAGCKVHSLAVKSKILFYNPWCWFTILEQNLWDLIILNCFWSRIINIDGYDRILQYYFCAEEFDTDNDSIE